MSPRHLSAASGRSRSFTGCSTCRTRHTKCDEGRPTCAACRIAGVECGGYEISIFFDFEGISDANIPRFRRPLLTKKERENMSEWLTASVSPNAVTRQLNEIDLECEAATSSDDVNVSRGPFGAFRVMHSTSAASDDLPDWAGDVELAQDIDEVGHTVDPLNGTLTPRTQLLFQSLLDVPEGGSLSPKLPMWTTTDEFSRFREVFDDVDTTTIFSVFGPQPPIVETESGSSINVSNYDAQPEHFGLSGSMCLSTTSTVPHDAVYLIKHYSTTVLTLLTPFRHSKTPWHVLFVPHAKTCLAALTLGEAMDHASLCAFYATLSISAVSLAGISQSNRWLAQGKNYLNLAREHVRLMLRTAYDYPKTAKYKHILIALLSMVQVAIVIDNHDQAECYFVEAEKFIRMKGLNRKKSRKVRLLHHCYVFERMFHESVYLAGTNSTHRSHARKAIESSGAMVYSHDSLSFRLGDLNDLESRMSRIKCREEGENDLHLQNPGLWPKTLYPEIFGLPEKYVFALSLIIRLGQWRDEAGHQDTADALSLTEFLSRAKTIERYIKQLCWPNTGADLPPSNRLEAPDSMLDDLLQAMQHALTIYFHRRIYDVEADMLQAHVVGVLDCLLRLEAAEAGTVYGSARMLWPAFIAACEAEDPLVQSSFREWFQISATRSGLPYFGNAKVNIERVWDERRIGQGSHVTWIDFMRREGAIPDVP
ncbi:hypothetical protein SVAN01_00749 [Stagonosporopsis vannaccii]|nr:hypothetical protein SVAN01_00749 [Stagonosporopsis vannaccii]